MAALYQNLGQVNDRIAYYTAAPDTKFRGDSGFSVEEETVFQKIRQYWADTSITDEEKLRGFEMDLSEFNPRETTFLELRKIALGLAALGIIDTTTSSVLAMVYIDYDRSGKQINFDKKVDVFQHFSEQLAGLSAYIGAGHHFASETLVKLNTGISVMLALDARAHAARGQVIVDTLA